MPDDFGSSIFGTTGAAPFFGDTATANGTIETSGDRDWFQISFEAGHQYQVELLGLSLSDPYIRGIHDSSGAQLPGTTDDDGGSGLDSLLYFTADQTSTYYISAGAFSTRTGSYVLSVTDLTPDTDDFGDNIFSAGFASVGSFASGEIEESGDQDWFGVFLEGGRIYDISLRGTETFGGTISDPYLRGIYNANGTLMPGSTDDDSGPGLDAYLNYVPDQDGYYYISAGGYASYTGTYTLDIVDVTPAPVLDDFSQDTLTTGTISVGSTAFGEIEESYDEDWFRATLIAGHEYLLELDGSHDGDGTLGDPYLRGIHDAFGNILPGTSNDDSGDGLNARVIFTADTSGTHYISAGAFSAGTGTYTMRLTDQTPAPEPTPEPLPTTDDYAASIATSGAVPVDGVTTGIIERADDQDWFRAALIEGHTYTVSLRGSQTSDGSLSDPYIRGVFDGTGQILPGTLDDDGGLGLNAEMSFTATSSGTHYISAGAFSTRVGSYTLELIDETPDVFDDFGESTLTAGYTSEGIGAFGSIEEIGDRDWFEAYLIAGTTYIITQSAASFGEDTLSDPFIRGIFDASGSLLPNTANDDGGAGLTAQLEFTPTESGFYYISAGAFSTYTGDYELRVDQANVFVDPGDFGPTPGSDDYAANSTTTGTLTMDGSAGGEIDFAGDEDWFAVTLEAGHEYLLDLEGLPTSAGTLSDPYLRGIFGAFGAVQPNSANDDGGFGLNSQLSFAAVEDGVHYISAGAFGGATGSYTLSITDLTPDLPDPVSPDDFGETVQTASFDLTGPGSSAFGTIEDAGDRDWFALFVDAGATYTVSLEGAETGAGTLGDPFIRGLFDGFGSPIAGLSDDDSGEGLNSLLEFTAEETGLVYISAGAFGSGTGSYTITVDQEENQDDFAGDETTTGILPMDGAVVGVIEEFGDSDWFAVTLAEGDVYTLRLRGADTDAGTLRDPLLNGVFTFDGAPVFGTYDDDGGVGFDSELQFTAQQSGLHYVSAGAFGGNIGSYELSIVNESTGDDFGESAGSSGAVNVGGFTRGDIEESGDRDWFAIEFDAGNTYRLDLQGAPTNVGTLSDPFIRGIYDVFGDLLPNSSNDDGGLGLNSRFEYTADFSGTHYLEAGAFGGSTGTYLLSVRDVTVDVPDAVQDDYGQTGANSGALTVGSSSTGEIEAAGDEDWFAVNLTGGRSYTIDLEGAGTGAGSLRDPYLRGIFDASGAVISGTLDDDGGQGLNSQLEFVADSSGLYFISAGAFGSNTGTYTVAIEEQSVIDDFGSSVGAAGTIEAGSFATGEIEEAHDTDWFGADLVAGRSYEIHLEGSATSGGTLSDPFLRGVFDANGVELPGGFDDDGGEGLNSLLEFTAEQSGVHYFAAGAFGSGIGSYTMTLTDVSLSDDYGKTVNSAGQMGVNQSVTGVIEAENDRDWFGVFLDAGVQYDISLVGSFGDGGTLVDPYLRGIFDANGILLPDTQNDDGGDYLNSLVSFTPTEGGQYYISAGAFGANTGSYTLTVEAVAGAADDYDNTVATQGSISVGASTVGVIETEYDEDWFALDLTAGQTVILDLEGDPTGQGSLHDPLLTGVYDTNGLFVGAADDDGGAGLNSRATFTASEQGTYFIGATAFGAATGTYSLTVTEVVQTDDFAADTATTGAVAVDGTTFGEIEAAGDTDWFAVDLVAGFDYRIDLEGMATNSGTLSDTYLRGLYDSTGTLIADTLDDDGGQGLNSRLEFTAEASDTYYIAAGAFADHTGTYKVTVTETGFVVADDFADDITTTGAAVIDGSAFGRIETGGDRDWFAMDVVAGRAYSISLEGEETDAGTLVDPYMRGVYDSTGTLISDSFDDDGGQGLNSLTTYFAQETGTVFISAAAFGYGTGSYTLNVSQLEGVDNADDFAADTTTTGSIAVGGITGGAIEVADDEDWFAVELEAGTRYEVDVLGVRTGNGSLRDPFLMGVYDANGRLQAGTTDDDDGEGLNSFASFVAAQDGTHYIAARAYNSGVGTYELAITEAADQPEPEPEAPAPQEGFNITLDFNGDDRFLSYFEDAAAAWEAIITEDLPDTSYVNLSMSGRSSVLVDDLLISASVVDIDGAGNILGQAGPTRIRADGTPFTGMMEFDVADLEYMVERGILGEVIEHEMGHVLGIGTLWAREGLISGDTYIGQAGINAFNALGGLGNSVPLSDSGHWSEEVFDTELMTPFAETEPPMPISIVSVGALQDLGYTVDYSEADDYSLPNLTVGALTLPPSNTSVGQDGVVTASRTIEIGDDFTGAFGQFAEDKAITLDMSDTQGDKLDGPVSRADENFVSFFDTNSGNGYFVQLYGDFEKNTPATGGDVKGDVTAMQLFLDGELVEAYAFYEPRDAETLLDNFIALGPDADNLVDILESFANADSITGGNGADFVAAAGGDDTLAGGAGNDSLLGEDGDDSLDGGVGDDLLNGGAGADAFNGGDGIDTVSYEGSRGSLRVDLLFPQINTFWAQGDTFEGIEHLIGSQGFENLRGTLEDNRIQGMANVDYIFGRRGNDTLEGGVGDDVLFGGVGQDVLIGGENRDRAQYSESLTAIVASLADTSLNTGEAAGDSYDSIEDLAGGAFADLLYGDTGDNRLFGREENDTLIAGAGNDYLNGGGNNDRLEGGAGDDTLRGGTSRDTFVFNDGADVVEDWFLDIIELDGAALGVSGLTSGQVVTQLGSVSGADFVLDFDNGDTLTLQGQSGISLTQLAGFIEIA